MPEQLTPQTFARTIKAKYPQYEHVPDLQLTEMILQKYPVYREKFRQSTMGAAQRDVLASEFEKANPGSIVTRDPNTGEMKMTQPGTAASRAREIAIGVGEPFTLGSLWNTIKQAGYAGYQAMANNPFPALSMMKGAVTAPVAPVVEAYKGLTSGNYEDMAHGTGGIVSQTLPAVEGTVGAAKEILPLAEIRDMARRGAQNMTGSSSFKTTEPIVKQYNADLGTTATRQAESDAAVAQKNAQAVQDAAAKTQKNQAAVTAKNEAAMNEADIKTEGNSAAAIEANKRAQAEHQQKLAEATAHNQKVADLQNQARTLDSQLTEGSEQLGNDVVDLDKKLRAEGNKKYDAVKSKIKDDPGVPTQELVTAAEKAQSMLKGAPESIRQFKDLMLKGADDAAGQVVNGVAPEPGSGLYKLMQEQGLINDAETLPFDQLQGYSSELGRKLAEGGLPGDVYQAVKFLKEQVDKAKAAVAERNGAGLELKEADSFWNKYMDTFYDKDSPITVVRKRVGVMDPEFYAEPFTKGKSAGVGASKLRGLPTQYADMAESIAAATERLRKAYADRGAMKIPTEKPIPAAPGQRVAGPRAMATLEPIPGDVTPKVTPNEKVPPPQEPTAQGIVDEKRGKVEAKGRGLAEVSKYDAGTIASAPIGVALGHPILGLVPLASKYGLSFLLTRPAILDWISKPTATDFAAIEKLPAPVQAQVRTGLQQFIKDEQGAGRPVKPSTQVSRFLAGVGNLYTPQNRREAQELMGQPTQ